VRGGHLLTHSLNVLFVLTPSAAILFLLSPLVLSPFDGRKNVVLNDYSQEKQRPANLPLQPLQRA
jgi:hypothetical protein